MDSFSFTVGLICGLFIGSLVAIIILSLCIIASAEKKGKRAKGER